MVREKEAWTMEDMYSRVNSIWNRVSLVHFGKWEEGWRKLVGSSEVC